MEASARVIASIIFILSLSLSPLASASFGKAVYEFFNPPAQPEIEPWNRENPDYGDHAKGKQYPKRLSKKFGFGLEASLNLDFLNLNEGPLIQGYYSKSCPRAEQIVTDIVTKAFQNKSEVAAQLLRLHFNDCFVYGCDASVLLNSTPSGEKTEKQALPNFTLKGYEIIDSIKSALERECPGIVSCADVLTFAARDSLVLSGIPKYTVLGGRLDSRVSREYDVQGNIPEPSDPLSKTIKVVQRKGLNIEDLVILQGAHSIGSAHCRNFAYRLEKPNEACDLDAELVTDIKKTCPTNRTRASLAMGRDTQYKMDAGFYTQLLEKKGLLESDVIMVNDSRTIDLVKKFSVNQTLWFEKFIKSMIRMGNIGVLTGTDGEIRKTCSAVN